MYNEKGTKEERMKNSEGGKRMEVGLRRKIIMREGTEKGKKGSWKGVEEGRKRIRREKGRTEEGRMRMKREERKGRGGKNNG